MNLLSKWIIVLPFFNTPEVEKIKFHIIFVLFMPTQSIRRLNNYANSSPKPLVKLLFSQKLVFLLKPLDLLLDCCDWLWI